ncbi:hypothetical protein BGX29_004410, partial [Mortierella sp. GBA35]
FSDEPVHYYKTVYKVERILNHKDTTSTSPPSNRPKTSRMHPNPSPPTGPLCPAASEPKLTAPFAEPVLFECGNVNNWHQLAQYPSPQAETCLRH